eukprot:CAMPEP_0198317664 /NCGR_PEP_ID=MMETSP1450-20131203/7114_1 /TAXON_ID=753684 ORGANISM="Madagascaria erythrocladiodes, Strain CCMP3234" /NCGR_SAMPLE_ID=MMETSP1450 /ASSEMBLY_ACC=CAM_ASM_001115 /LENGTH=291 /DNA_ID=CAMNT_0044020893 /DNA_START=25 /DNA_END=900 /DNA_ORIENTATION=+
MTDRLAELRGDDYDEEAGESGDVEAGMSPEFAKYSRELAVIEKAIGKIQGAADTVAAMYGGSEVDDAAAVEKLDDADKKAAAVRKRLKRIADENRTFAANNQDKVGETKVRVNRHQGITRSFMAATEALQNTRDLRKTETEKAIARQIRAVNPDASQAQIDAAVKSNDLSQVFDQETLSSRHRQIKERLGDIQAKNADIQAMEQNIVQLHQMFVDMSLLVENQGELLNEVEYNTKQTVEKVEEAHAEVVQARDYQKKARKKCFWFTLIIIAIILAIVIPIVITQLRNRGII